MFELKNAVNFGGINYNFKKKMRQKGRFFFFFGGGGGILHVNFNPIVMD
jgi:hypothetical protein